MTSVYATCLIRICCHNHHQMYKKLPRNVTLNVCCDRCHVHLELSSPHSSCGFPLSWSSNTRGFGFLSSFLCISLLSCQDSWKFINLSCLRNLVSTIAGSCCGDSWTRGNGTRSAWVHSALEAIFSLFWQITHSIHLTWWKLTYWKISLTCQLVKQSSHFVCIPTLPVPEIKALSLIKLHTSGGRRNM